jgi:drug/metabolite transporter (DMT)-like permease
LGDKSFSPMSLFVSQTITMIVITLPLSLITNDWSVWYDMKWSHWIVFFTLSIAVFLFAALMLISTVQVLGAANASCMLGLRLVSTIVVSGFLLHEWLDNFWQIVGSLLVLIALTIFLFHQRHLHRKKNEAIEEYRAWYARNQQNEATASA